MKIKTLSKDCGVFMATVPGGGHDRNFGINEDGTTYQRIY